MYQLLVEFVVTKNTFEDSFFLSGLNFFLQGIFFIVFAYFISPKFKIKTLKIFLILWILIVVVGDYYLYYKNMQNVGIWNSILRILGALLAYLNITLEHKNEVVMLNNEETTEKKQINLSETERQDLIDKIKENASKNPEYKNYVEEKLLEKKNKLKK